MRLQRIIQEAHFMPTRQVDRDDIAYIPLWLFFATGYKWIGGFLCGFIGMFFTELLTTNPLWIYLATSATTFVGWSTGTYLDINTYLNDRLQK
jgi:hypothetical protein